MNRVYWDSMLFVYLLEKHPVLGPKVVELYESMTRRSDTLCSSIFTLGEVLTGPRKRNDQVGIRGIREFFAGEDIELLPFTFQTADRYSVIRATNRVSQADAIHLATAAEAGVDILFTNDTSLRKLSIPGIKFFADLDGKLI